MNIGGISGTGSQGNTPGTGAAQGSDAQSKNLQKQITEAEKKLQEIASNGELSAEEKTKKRQEIQKEINELRMQLRQHEAELRRRKQEEKQAAADSAKAAQKPETQQPGVSQAGMEAVISADTSVKQAKVQRSVAVRMEGKAGVLEAEIKQDGGSSAKEAELARVKKRAEDANRMGMNTLKEANRELEMAADREKAEETSKREEKEAGKTGEKREEGKTDKTGESGPEAEIKQAAKSGKGMETQETEADGAEKKEEKMPGIYVDVRL